MRAMYASLTMDSAADQNPDMDERLRMALLGEPGIVVDLRHLNKGRPGDTFNVFFEQLQVEVEEVSYWVYLAPIDRGEVTKILLCFSSISSSLCIHTFSCHSFFR